MKVEKHISDLLYEHNCVIVPELGGFVGNYAPAKIHPVRHTFTPPSKSIVFNKHLKNNDGLLANQLVVNEQITYPQALQHISHFVDNVQGQLKKGAKVKIDNVGTLYLDVERSIQFEPSDTNFLNDSFGFEEFRSPAVRQEKVVKRIEKEFKDREPLPSGKQKINVKRVVALTIAISVFAALVWLPIQTGLFKSANYSDLNPFASHEVIKPEMPGNTVPTAKLNVSATTSADTVKQPVTAQLVEPVKADTTAVVANTVVPGDTGYHLVAGCFQIEENATKFVESLKAQQIDANIIGKNNKGLFVVSCGDFTTRHEALKNLESLRKIQPKAWLYQN